MACFARQSNKEETSLRTGFSNRPLACWLWMDLNPLFSNKKDTAKGDVFFVGGGRWIRILLDVSIITF